MTNEAIQNREPFLQNLREKLDVEKQPVRPIHLSQLIIYQKNSWQIKHQQSY